MKRQTYFEPYLILAIVIQAVLLVNLYVMTSTKHRVGISISAVLCVLSLVWIVGRIYAIFNIRAEQHPMYMSVDQLRAELIRTHDWWTGSQIDELLTRYMAAQQGEYQKWLVDNVTVVDLTKEMIEKGEAPGKDNG